MRKSHKYCSVDGCNEKYYCKGLCNYHWQRKRNGVSIDLPKFKNRGGIKSGPENRLWNGGISKYKNAGDWRRSKKLLNTSRCQICNDPAQHVHHKDLSKSNHNIENLLVVCVRCHFGIHKMLRNRNRHPNPKALLIHSPTAERDWGR